MDSHYHEVDGVRVFCVTTGRGAPVLLLHGFLTSHRCWDRVVGQLGDRALHALDLPGFGESDRPEHYSYSIDAMAGTVSRVMDKLGVSRAAVVGHSLGGAVALALAALSPQRVERVVAVGPAVYPVPLSWEGRFALLPVVGELFFTKLLSRRDLRRYFRRDVYVDPQLPDEEMLQYYWERLNRPGGRRAAHRVLRTIERLDRMATVPGRVTCPALLVWGEGDRAVPASFGTRLQAEMRSARLVTIPGAGHAPMEEQPERFSEVVRPFLSSAEPQVHGEDRP